MDAQRVIAKEAAENPSYRRKVSETLDLHGLLEHPGWLALKEHFKRGSEGYGRGLTSRQLAGVEVSQREIDYYRGSLEMAQTIFKYPEIALANLEQTTERLLRNEFEQEAEGQLAFSPYIDQEVT